MTVASDNPTPPTRLGIAFWGLLTLATWALSHRYQGLVHDSGLYTLQALARLHPQTVAADVFLKNGSQDRFTLFSPIYAAASRLLGIEPAAALLTLAGQIALTAGALSLARGALSLRMALLGIAVLIAIPGYYGPDRVFTCLEPFLTPRMPAEALVLGALAAVLKGRVRWSLTLMVMAGLLHPIMAMAGVCALFWILFGAHRPWAAIGWTLCGMMVLIVAALAIPVGPLSRFDAGWLTLIHDRSPYLFLSSWELDDWSRTAVTAGTLAIGLRVLDGSRARTLAAVTFATCLTGLAVSAVAGDGLHLVLFTQLQPWRWLWLATVVAALLIPEILRVLFKELQGRATGLLLLAAWIFASNPYALVSVAASILSLAAIHRLKHGEARWVLVGAIGLVAIAAIWRIASNLEFTESHYLDATVPLWVRRAIGFTLDGSVPAALLVLVWWLGEYHGRRFVLIASAVLGAAACAVIMPSTIESWTDQEFPPEQFARFAVLRQGLSPTAEIFWPESPLGVWMLLDRPSYLSVIQTSGMVFSRPSAWELKRRAESLQPSIGAGTFLRWQSGTGLELSRQQLIDACAGSSFDYLVTRADLGTVPAAMLSERAPSALRLYRCKAGEHDLPDGSVNPPNAR